MKPRIIYVDGFNYFYRAFSKDKTSTNSDGEAIGGVITFMRQLFSTINYLKPLHVVICFDGDSAGERRRSIFKNYKNRRGRRIDREVNTDFNTFKNEDLQVELLFELLSYFPFIITKVDYLEADDIIQYLAYKNKDNYEQFICSTDKDYYQLVDTNIKIWSAEKKIIIDKNNFKNYYKILPENFIYYKILNGDNSDKINGVKGLGNDRILKYLPILKTNKINNLTELYNYIDDIKDDKTKTLKSLKESKDILSMNYKLMKLSEDNMSLKSINNLKEQIDIQNGFKVSILKTFGFLQKKKYNTYFTNANYITSIIKNISTKIKLEI